MDCLSRAVEPTCTSQVINVFHKMLIALLYAFRTYIQTRIGVSVPLFLHSPLDMEQAGRVSDNAVNLLDITPTVLDWFQIEYPIYHILKPSQPTRLLGTSLLPLLRQGGCVTLEHNDELFISSVKHYKFLLHFLRVARGR